MRRGEERRGEGPPRKPASWSLRSAFEALPENERERHRRVNKYALLQVTETHPPTHLRISVLRGLDAGIADCEDQA